MLVREAFHSGSVLKNPPAVKELQGMWVRSLAWAGALEEGMATHSSILCLKIPWTEEPGGLQSMGSQRVGHDWNDSAYNTPCLKERTPKWASASKIWVSLFLKPASCVAGGWPLSLEVILKDRHMAALIVSSLHQAKGATAGSWLEKLCFYHPALPWRRKWQPTLVSLPWKSHGQRSLVGYSQGGHEESDTTEHTPSPKEDSEWVYSTGSKKARAAWEGLLMGGGGVRRSQDHQPSSPAALGSTCLWATYHY